MLGLGLACLGFEQGMRHFLHSVHTPALTKSVTTPACQGYAWPYCDGVGEYQRTMI